MSVGMRQLHRAACVHSRQVVTIATRVIPHQRWFFDLLDITDHYYLTRSRSSQPVHVLVFCTEWCVPHCTDFSYKQLKVFMRSPVNFFLVTFSYVFHSLSTFILFDKVCLLPLVKICVCENSVLSHGFGGVPKICGQPDV